MIKVKPKVIKKGNKNSLENENGILTALKKLTNGDPMKAGIIEKVDFVSTGYIIPRKSSNEANVLTCNAIVIVLLETDLCRFVKPNTYTMTAKNIFQYTYDLVKQNKNKF